MKKKRFIKSVVVVMMLIMLISLSQITALAEDNSSGEIIFSDNFDKWGKDGYVEWQKIDANNDESTWNYYINNDDISQISCSYNDSVEEFEPDDYLLSPIITVPETVDSIKINWTAWAGDTVDFAEKYSVYVVGTEATTASAISVQTPIFTETLDTIDNVERSVSGIDITGFEGKNIRIVFRHYDCNQQASLSIDNIEVWSNDNVDAQLPQITNDLISGTYNVNDKIVEELTINVNPVSDGGVLTYQWYSNDENSTEGGTKIDGASGTLADENMSARYTPSIKEEGTTYYYVEITNTLGESVRTVTSNVVTITVINTDGNLWNGTSVSQPALVDGYYQISSAEELAWFAGFVNGTLTDVKGQNLAANAILTEDIDLNNQIWTPIGGSSINPAVPFLASYSGEFNGNGHKIYNLHIDSKLKYTGLFSMNKGFIRNLTIESGSITSTEDYLGAFAGENVTDGVILNCLNNANVNSSNKIVGGIAGRTQGKIINCANTGAISTTSTIQSVYASGISFTYRGTILNCYNTGSVTAGDSNKLIGGISCTNRGGFIENCYNTGIITGGTVFPISSKSIDCYYLDITGTDSHATSLTIEKMKSPEFLEELGGIFSSDVDINDGYPIFLWQAKGIYPELETTEDLIVSSINAVNVNVVDKNDISTVTLTINKCLYYTELDLSDFVGTISINGEEPKVLEFVHIIQNEATITLYIDKLEQTSVDQEIVLTVAYKDTNAKSISLSLEKSHCWKYYVNEPSIVMAGDKTYPEFAGYYKISSAGELAWFAGLINGTLDGVEQNTHASAFLTTDIYLNNTDNWMSWDENTTGLKIWTPIGSFGDHDNNSILGFSGIFSGNGHAVYGIYTDGSDLAAGLFGRVVEGKIMDLGVRDSFIYQYEGCCGVGNATLSHAGGIAGIAKGKYGNYSSCVISNCYNTATVKIKGSYNSSTVGGIVGGLRHATIRECYNTGLVVVEGSLFRTYYASGIAGSASEGSIENCYNLGVIQAISTKNNSNVAGISQSYIGGSAKCVVVENCYNAGSLRLSINENCDDENRIHYIAGDRFKGSNINSYYLSGCVEPIYTYYQIGNVPEEKGISEFTNGTVADLLGDAFVSKEGVNGGFPYLSGQIPVAAWELPKLNEGVSSVISLTLEQGVSDYSIDLTDIFEGTNLEYKVKVDNGDYSVMDSAIYSGTLTGDQSILTFTANAGYIDGATYIVTVQKCDANTARSLLLTAYENAKALSVENYYTSEDRWNGKTVYSGSKGGFWNELQSILISVESLLSSTATDEEYNDKTQDINDMVAELIPVSRVNATLLYENYHNIVAGIEDASINFDRYTKYSAKVCNDIIEEAQIMISSLYDEAGEPTDKNTYDMQVSVNNMTQKVSKSNILSNILLDKINEENANLCYTSIVKMLGYYNTDDLIEKDYTSESWNSLCDACSSAQNYLSENPTLIDKYLLNANYKELSNLNNNLFNAGVGLKNSAVYIQYHVRVADNYSIQNTNKALDEGLRTFNDTVIMTDGRYSFADLENKLGIRKSKEYLTLVYVNGVLMHNPCNNFSLDSDMLMFRNGDEVVISIVECPMVNSSSQNKENANYTEYKDSLALFEIVGDEVIEVEAGERFTLSVSKIPCLLLDDSNNVPAVGVSLFYGDVADSQDAVNPSYINGGFVSDDDGNVSMGLYSEGWYYVSVMDITPSILGGYDSNVNKVDGSYPNIAASDNILVHVVSSSNPDKVKTELQDELDEIYNAYPESFFRTDNWLLLKEAYEKGTAGIANAETLGIANIAQDTAISTIKGIQENTISDNTTKLNKLRYLLKRLPDDVAVIDNSAQGLIDALISTYESLSEYQLTQLTGVELQKYNAIVEANNAGLPDAVEYTLKFQVEGDTEDATLALQSMYEYLQVNPANEDTLASGWGGKQLKILGLFNQKGSSETTSRAMKNLELTTGITYSTYFQTRDAENHILQVENENWHITHENFAFSKISSLNCTAGDATVYVGDIAYEIKGYRFDGISEESIYWRSLIPLEYTTYLGIDKDCVNVKFENAMCSFAMPFGNVTITAIWGPVVSDDEIISAKEAAKMAINSSFNSYNKIDYSEKNWNTLVAAKETGLRNLDKATNLDEIVEARKVALAEMAAVLTIEKEAENPISGGQSGMDLPDYGAIKGKVHIIVENQTFTSAASDGSLPAWKGILIDGWYDLCENDTMMTVVLKALQLKGCHWSTGSQGVADVWDDYGINYLASVNANADIQGDGFDFWIDPEGGNLGEFSGEAGSGWMGTLNGWFVNKGFPEFNYNNGYLENGDEIKIMFTQNLGVDLGGSWGNSDTSLSDLSISGGSLMPKFDSDMTSYGLIIPSSEVNLKVTPEASNKNYMVKIFLNNYNNDGALYKLTEIIPVKNGDIVYVGCGEYEWPSMNNQETEAREYTGTKYTIKVYDNIVNYVIDFIDVLVDEKDINMSNYDNYTEELNYINSIYNSLTATQKKSVTNYDRLVAVKDKYTFYLEIQEVKNLLAKIPHFSKIKLSDKNAVLSADKAYKALSEEQKLYITVGDVENYNAALEVLDKKFGAFDNDNKEDIPSIINGSNEKPEDCSKITPDIIVNNGKATASVEKEEVDKILEYAKENDITNITIDAVTDEDITASIVKIPGASISDIAKKGLSLIIETASGTFEIDNNAIEVIASKGNGSVEMSFEKIDSDKLSQKNKDLVENHPIFDLSISVGGSSVTDFGKEEITVKLPYTSVADENENNLTVYYLDDEGNAIEMSGAYYDKSSNYMIFKTNHFSVFAIVCEDKINFTDVKEGAWYYDTVQYVVNNGLFSGTSDTTFSPDSAMTRAMLVTVLYRLEGKPEVLNENIFTDVKAGAWYENAVKWASKNGITSGYGEGIFGTNDAITREQLTTILYNYAKYKGYDIDKTADISNYIDADNISSWAKNSFTWACGSELVNGITNTTLEPKSSATRAQVATILMRFCNLIK